MHDNLTSSPPAVHPATIFSNFSKQPAPDSPELAMRYYEDDDEVSLDMDYYWDKETDDFTFEKTFRYDDEDDDLTWYGEDDTECDE